MSVEVRVRTTQGLPGPPGASGGTSSEVSAQTDSDVEPGQAVYVTETSRFDLAQADSTATARAIGISISSTLATFAATVRTQDHVTLTSAQWDAVTGQSGGLTPGATYYLSTTTAGGLTKTPPTASPPSDLYNVRMGVAVTPLILDLRSRAPVKL